MSFNMALGIWQGVGVGMCCSCDFESLNFAAVCVT
jgi:hypothetical protein